VNQIRVEFDRPFGFLASHRKTGLILAAGRVAEREPYQPTAEEFEIEAQLRAWREGLGESGEFGMGSRTRHRHRAASRPVGRRVPDSVPDSVQSGGM
jgi:hypothetical protein